MTEPRTENTTVAPALDAQAAENSAMFARIADDYDRFNKVSSFGLDRFWRRRLVGAPGELDGMRVLDVACGSGDVGLSIATDSAPARIVLSDLTPAMLDVARHRGATVMTATPIEYVAADARALPFDDASFDHVFISFGLRNVPDRPAALREMRRVLAPGGMLHCLEFSQPALAPIRAAYHAWLDTVIPLQGKLVAGERDSFDYLARSIESYPDRAEVVAMFEAAGFMEVTAEPLLMGGVCIHRGVKGPL